MPQPTSWVFFKLQDAGKRVLMNNIPAWKIIPHFILYTHDAGKFHVTSPLSFSFVDCQWNMEYQARKCCAFCFFAWVGTCMGLPPQHTAVRKYTFIWNRWVFMTGYWRNRPCVVTARDRTHLSDNSLYWLPIRITVRHLYFIFRYVMK